MTVIGAPTPTVDGVSLDGPKAFPGARTLDPGSFPLPASQEITILAGTVASGTRIRPEGGLRSWTEYRDNASGSLLPALIVPAGCGSADYLLARALRVSGPRHDDYSNEVACLPFDGARPHRA